MPETLNPIHICEVGPRDGLQNEKKRLALADKQIFVEKLIESGLQQIEVGAFVRPDLIPQLADTDELVSNLKMARHFQRIAGTALVPNREGMDRAIELKMEHVAFFTATSEAFTKKNVRMTIDASIENYALLADLAREKGMRTRVYLSTIGDCPFEGRISIKTCMASLEKISERIRPDEIILSDTTGKTTPAQIEEIVRASLSHTDLEKLGLHLHDTYGFALANAWKGLEMGVMRFDGSAAGLGGCPYAPGSGGNIATEDLIYLCEQIGLKTGIDLEALFKASEFVLEKLGKHSASKVYRAMKGRKS